MFHILTMELEYCSKCHFLERKVKRVGERGSLMCWMKEKIGLENWKDILVILSNLEDLTLLVFIF